MSGAFAAYLALKAASAKKVETLAAQDKTYAAAEAENTKDLAALAQELKKLLGEPRFAGAKAKSVQFQPETLFPEVGAGDPDAFVFRFDESPTTPAEILLTDTALVAGAAAKIKASYPLLAEAVAAAGNDDAALEVTGEVPLPKGADGIAFAGYYTQEDDPIPPTALFAAVRRGSKLYVARFDKLTPPPPPPGACAKVAKKKWADCYVRVFEGARAAYTAPALAALKMIP